MNLKDVGWVWEGQGIYRDVPPSIYGLGQGAAYFGLSRVNYMFHPNDEHALNMLAHLDEVTCEITKWQFETNEDRWVRVQPNASLDVVRCEAQNGAELSRRFANLTGLYHDDLHGLMKRENLTPKDYGKVRNVMREINPALKLWTVVYTHEFGDADFWRSMAEHIDVVALWVWESKDLVNLKAYVDQCRALLPDKPIVMGVYLRDYTPVAPVPVERVVRQMRDVADLIDEGKLAGFAVLASVLIDGHRAQAEAVRDFIAEHSA